MTTDPSTSPPEDTDTEEEEEPTSLATAVGKAVGLIENALGNGERAELRRANPDEPYSAALWKILTYLPDSWTQGEERERRWGLFLTALMQGWDLHSPQQGLGAALAEAGYSEIRLNRLLRADETQLTDELRLMAKFLASKRTPVNWTQVAALLFYSGDLAQRHRRTIARDYYRVLYRNA